MSLCFHFRSLARSHLDHYTSSPAHMLLVTMDMLHFGSRMILFTRGAQKPCLHNWSVMDIYIYYTPRCQLIRTHVNKYRPGEALDIQSELIFANGMVHLSKEWNFDTPTSLFSWATPLLPVTATPEAIFLFTWHHTFNIPTYKIIAMCIECVTVLRANNTRVKHEYRMSGSSLEG